MSVAGAFDFNPLSLPFVFLTLGLLALVVTTMLVQGDLAIRAALMTSAVMTLPWSAGTALTMSMIDRDLVEQIARLYMGTVALLGPTTLLVLLALGGQMEQHRPLIFIFAFVGFLACTLIWATDLVVGWKSSASVSGVWETPWGILYPVAGPLFPVVLGFLALALALGGYLARHVLTDQRAHLRSRTLMVILLGAVLCGTDSLLAYGIGVYPLSVIPGLGLVVYLLWALLRKSAMPGQGQAHRIDWSSAVELVVLVSIIPLVAISVWAAAPQGLDGGPLVVMLLLVPLFATAQAISLMIHSYVEPEPVQDLSAEADQALEQFAEFSMSYRDEAQLATALIDLLAQHTRLSEPRLYLAISSEAWLEIATTTVERSSIPVPAEATAWLLEQRTPVLAQDIQSKLRVSMQALFDSSRAQLLVPLIERDMLVGAIVASLARDARSLGSTDFQIVQETARVAARVLTSIRLFREANERIEMDRELEVAAAARRARTPGEERRSYLACEVIGHYQAAPQFGGDWWTSHQLADGRVLMVIGDVTGHGVPTALVSATVASACETARQMLGARVDVRTLMGLLDDAVLSVGAGQYTMSCCAAILDPVARRITFANAGYPTPWVCRQPPAGVQEAELHALEPRGTRLGSAEPSVSVSSFEVQDDDAVVFYSDSLLESPNPEGERYGEQRLQRVLRQYVRGAGDRACEIIIQDALAHCGDQPLIDDVTVVVLRLSLDRARRELSAAAPARS